MTTINSVNDLFDYGSFLVQYVPETGAYQLTDIDYGYWLGAVTFEEGPGAIFTSSPAGMFLDAAQTNLLLHFLNEVNRMEIDNCPTCGKPSHPLYLGSNCASDYLNKTWRH